MIPILYGPIVVALANGDGNALENDGAILTGTIDRVDYDTLGIGAMVDAITCVVTEERNGKYELTMTYPVDGVRYKDIREGCVIKATPSKGREPDLFRIYSITRPISGIIEIQAEHISYQLSHIPVMPFTASSCAGALNGLKTNSAEPNPFTFWTDKGTVATYKQTVPASLRSRLGGTAGSILDVYGGEYEFDNYDVKLYANRGADRGVTLRYGKNIIDLTQETNIANTITGVCPYWADDEGNVVTLPEKVMSVAAAGKFPYPRTITKDFSQDFEDQPTVEQLRARAQSYIQSSGIGVPDVSIDVSFVDLTDSPEYKDIALLEGVKLCDTVHVYFEPLNIETTAKCVSTKWNVLADRYDEITLGTVKTNLAGIVASRDRELTEAIDGTKSILAREIEHATEQITGADGGYVVINRDADGNPYELLVMNEPTIETATRVWRWNQYGLGVSNNGYAGPFETAMTADGHFVANFITAGTMVATLIKAGVLSDVAGNFYLDMETGQLVMQNGTFNGTIVSNNATITGGVISLVAANSAESRFSLGFENNSWKYGILINPAMIEATTVAKLVGATGTGTFGGGGMSQENVWDSDGSGSMFGASASQFYARTRANANSQWVDRVVLDVNGLRFYNASGTLTKTYSAT